MMGKDKLYFKNLNSIRFFAAFLVIIAHIEGYKRAFQLPNIYLSVNTLGELGVVLFFVLSGFLITYLMLVEEQKNKTINIKRFYVRRILRIWPLYYIIVFLSFLFLPNFELFIVPGWEPEKIYPNFPIQLIFLIIFLPNLLAPIYGLIPGTNQLWSIGAEEQFYLFWPVFFILTKKRRYVLFIGLILSYIIIRYALYQLPFLPHKKVIISFWEHCNIDCMAIGGVFALIHYTQKKKLLSILYNKWLQSFVLLFILLSVFRREIIPETYYFEILSVLFGIMILNFATNPKPLMKLENTLTNYLGKISYGLYMYHMLAIIFSINILTKYNLFNDFLLYPLVIILTLILSVLSYTYIEKYFIDIKTQYSTIITGDKAKDESETELYSTKKSRVDGDPTGLMLPQAV